MFAVLVHTTGRISTIFRLRTASIFRVSGFIVSKLLEFSRIFRPLKFETASLSRIFSPLEFETAGIFQDFQAF